jgi:hypothetical protein
MGILHAILCGLGFGRVGSGIGYLIEATSTILFILPGRTLQLSNFLNKVIFRQSNNMIPMK